MHRIGEGDKKQSLYGRLRDFYTVFDHIYCCRSAIMAPKPIVPMENGVDPREVEALIYLSVGVAIAFLLTASMMFAVCQCMTR